MVLVGERRALIGPNGAGKTTLFNIITGELAVDAGRIEMFGTDITHKTVQERARLGLGRTYQISQLFLNLTVEENLFLAAAANQGVEFNFLSSWRKRAKFVQRLTRPAEQVNLTPYLSQLVSELSHGLQRQLEIGIAIAMRPRLIMLDEPAAGLSPSERLVLTGLIKGLSREVTLILIEHDMEVVLDIADRITVLQHGSVIAEGAPAQIRTNQQVQNVYLGISMAKSTPIAPARLEVSDLHAYYGKSHVLQGCSLTVDQGCVAVLGRNGMGKTTLLRSVMGLTSSRSGSIRWRDKEITGKKPFMIASMGIGYVPQGRRLFPSLSVDEHLTLTYRQTDVANAWTPQRVYDLFPELAERRKLSGARLSGGEQQMLAIGRALVTNPTLILLDEPSEGLAPVAIQRVVETCRELRKANISILLVEQNIHVAAAFAERIYILLSGMTVYESAATTFLENLELRQKYLGV